MNVAVVYIYPMAGANGYLNLAARFITSYHRCPSEFEHQTIIVSQSSPASDETKFLFSSLPNVSHFTHDNSGYDIGAFQRVAREVPADLMIFFGATSYIKCVGWVRRAVESFIKYGDTLYGTMGHRGALPGVHPHIRTTGFWMNPQLLNRYPTIISRPDQRYGFEHGPNCLTSWIFNSGKTPWVVAYDDEYAIDKWDLIPNGYHQGDQSNLLTGDRMTAPPFYHTE
jgi:hypothetical protein